MTRARAIQKAKQAVPVPILRFDAGEVAGTVIRLEEDAGTLGRRTDNTYVVSDPHVSRVHARISREAGSVVVTDLGSSGGTRVNGELIRGSATVNHGDTVAFGGVTAAFEDPAQLVADEEETLVVEPEPEAGPDLSPRQMQVLSLVAEGLTNREIGEELGVTERTVKAYTGEIYSRLGASNRAGAVAEAARLGLL